MISKTDLSLCLSTLSLLVALHFAISEAFWLLLGPRPRTPTADL